MTITGNGTITPETPAGIIAYGWEVYRRSQQVPWPQDPEAAGTLMRAQSRLWHQAAPFACVSLYLPGREPDLDGIQKAAEDVIAAIGEHCGTGDAAFVSGGERGEGND